MAEAAAVSSLVDLIINKLGSAIWNELGSVWGVKDDIQKLQRLLSTIRAVLDEAGRRSISDIALRKWLQDLKEAALDAEDVVDEFQTEALQRKMEGHRPITGKVCGLFSSCSSVGFRFKMARKMKDVTRRFSEIAEERRDFHLSEHYASARREDRETYSFVVESSVYGRNDDKEKVMKFLTDVDADADVAILPIVGLGGIGKTTLAQLVYNDVRIKEHFELQLWVCVTENFDVKHIAKAIAESATKGDCRHENIDNIQQLVRQLLQDKRFLLVLDDVWSEDPMEWERLKPLLRGSKHGNKIIVTTRTEIVARIMGTVDTPFHLEVLSVDDCWNLFRNMAFGQGREQETPKLVEIGKEIVSKCGGLPLAAKALGSLMASRRGESEWMDIKNSEIWKLPEDQNGILPALRLSYEHLPPDLKRCFAYCRLFPKDHDIDRLKLVQLWIAEGLIRSSDGDMFAEDIGNRYFNSLLWRSFFQDEEKDDLGNVVSCKMHDLVHDLACFVAKDEYSIIEATGYRSVPLGCRYYSVICDKNLSLETLKFGCEANKVRSLIFLGEMYHVSSDMEESLLDTISNLSYLRVLHLSHIGIQNFPGIMSKLKYLRFLDLSSTNIEMVPDCIAGIFNLQRLNLRNCICLKELPEAISSMSNLRHLDISHCGLTCMPHWLGRLTGLQTLPLFIVGEEPGRSIAELQHLNLIRGELTIRCLRDVKDAMEAMEAKLRAKTYIHQLELSWVRNEFSSWRLRPPRSIVIEEDVLENLQPPNNLSYLRIHRYSGSKCPSWLKKMDPSSSFSSLKTVELHNLPNMEEWFVPDVEMFPCLQRLVLKECPKLIVQPCMPSSIVELEIRKSNEELFAASGSLQGLSRLRKLRMSHIRLTASAWGGLQYLTALQELSIASCSDLICVPDCILKQHFPSLRTLELSENHVFISLGEGGGQGGEEPPRFFTSLQHLIIWNCHELPILPAWFGGLSSLQFLTLGNCFSLAMLPDGLRCLTGLRRLTVDNCPLLGRRCEEGGEDWYKIAHIPDIQNVNVWFP